MSRQSDPVPALDRSHLLFQILYDDYLTAFLVVSPARLKVSTKISAKVR